MVVCWSSFGLDVITIYIMTTVCISFLLKTIIFHYSISDASPWQPAKKKKNAGLLQQHKPQAPNLDLLVSARKQRSISFFCAPFLPWLFFITLPSSPGHKNGVHMQEELAELVTSLQLSSES